MTNQEAIDIIKTAIAQVEWDYPMDYAAAFDMAIKALENGWISVMDMEPETNNEVLVWAYGCNIGEYLDDGLWWVNGLGQTRIVTHWMPFPTQPEVNGNDD